MNTILQCRNLQIQANRFKKENQRNQETGTPFSYIFRSLDNFRLNSLIMDQILSIAGNFFGSIRQRVIKWNLGGIFWTILLTIYQIAIRPLMMLLMRYFRILLRWVEKTQTALQEYFYGKMEELFNHEEPGDYLFKLQCTNGQQVEYQYEIAWVERTFDIMQVVKYVMLNINHKILATFEKAQLKFFKFQNRHHAAQVFQMPEFEITNPEIFNHQPSEILTSKIENTAVQANNPFQNMIKTTVQQHVKFFLFLENRFSLKQSGIKIQHQLSEIPSVRSSGFRPNTVFQNITNQLLSPEIANKIKQNLRIFKIKCLNLIHHLKYYRKL